MDNVRVQTKELSFSTKGNGEIIDLTDKIQNALHEAKFKDGIVTCFVVGSTSGITTIEYEPGLLQDLPNLMEKLIPVNDDYKHNATWGDGNGFSHLRHSLIGASLTIPFEKGHLLLGTWQQVVFLEFDNTQRQRTVILQFMGV
ncbi:MAG: secondary thiamine-phosphate synthase enzyme YjbQ [Candidatus Saelkia tenebricola]|nr:secondary thiamine-phosphate synthase enzyme YjbQ [Candidatus Saelkia tenebricola]